MLRRTVLRCVSRRDRKALRTGSLRHRLAIEPLEDRRLLAVSLQWSGAGSVLSLNENLAGATPTIVISEPSPNIDLLKIDLGAGNVFAGNSTTSVAGLTYQNANSPATSQFATIDISETDNVSSLAATLPGDKLTLGLIRDLSGGVGSITASAAGIEVVGVDTFNANGTAGGGNLNLTASRNLTVDAGAIVQTGTGTISLAAGGTGTLAIGAGATVTSTNTSTSAITLQGGTITIDPTAAVAAQRILGTTAANTLTALDVPQAMALDSSGDLYVANGGNNSVSEFAANSTTLIKTLTGLNNPDALAFDGSGDLFVANYADGSGTTVSEFAPNSTTPTATLTGVNGPDALAFDGSGDLFVANYNKGSGTTVKEFLPGHTTASATLSGLSGPRSLAFDASGDLYVANYGSGSGTTVKEFLPGHTTASTTLKGLAGPDALAFDGSGNLYVANYGNATVSRFAAGSSTASATLTGLDQPDALAFDGSGNLYVANDGNATVSKFAAGSTTASATLTGLDEPDALAFDGSGNLYVANDGGTTASEFVPASTSPAPGGVVMGTTTVVTANSSSSVYGQSVTFTAAVTAAGAPVTGGAVDFEEGSTILAGNVPVNSSGDASFSTAALSAGSPVITAVYLGTSQYLTSSASAGTLTVAPAPLTITANNQSMIYGAGLPTLTASYSGFVNGDNSSSLTTAPTLATTATAASHVSGSPYTITASGAVDANYSISYVAGALTVTPAPLTITANNQSMIYGAGLPTLTAAYSGFVNQDSSSSLTTAPTLATTATAASHVSGSPYTITASGAVDADYTISYVAGALTVTPAPLTITANNQSMVYGAGLPTLTAAYSGFVNQDSSSSLTTAPTLATTATAASHVSGNPYTITASGAVDADYTISYVAGALTVTPASLTITANNQSMIYGAGLPTLTAGYSGFVNQDNSSSLTTAPTLATTATAASHVSGSPYTITASGAVDPDYTISYVAGALTVTPAPLTITANNQSMIYGAGLPTLTAAYSGFVNQDSSSSLTTAPILATTATAASHASGSPYTITASGAVDADYTISYVAGALTVTPAPLTISADNQSMVYGAALPTLTASYSGLTNGDTSASLTSAPTLSTTATAGSHVSGNPYTITASGAVDADYSISYVAGALTVDPAPLTISADTQSMVYGAGLPTLTASYSGLVNADTPASLTTAPTLSTTATAASHVSGNPYTITASGAVDADYTINYAAGALTVTAASLTITANNQSMLYGSGVPTLTASYSGLTNGDTSASLTTAPTLSTTASAASHVSGNPYTITASGAADADYTISYATGALTIDPAPLTITADNQSMVYGAALPTLTASYWGFVNGDTSASLTTAPTLSTTATTGSHVSGNPYTITASGAMDADYSISYVAGALSIDPASLTITADNQSMVYGAALPTLTASYSGFVNGDSSASLTTVPALSTTATAASHVSGNPYTITASGAADADYTISYVAGALTVTPAPLTITANNESKVYGAALPTLTASYSGLVNGDTSASLTTVPTLSTTATSASHVSGNPYTITANGAADADYTISYVAGALTVTPAPLTITANNESKVYGAALPTLTASYTGLVNGDTSSSLTTAPTLSTTVTPASHVSGNPYTINASGAVDADYSISYIAGLLAVTPAPLTITANNQSKIYGAALPTLTASYSGLVNGDTLASLTSVASLATTATAASHVSGSPYTISASGAADADYTMSYAAGTLTVTPAPLTVVANNQSKVYGAALPTLTASYTGLVNGDTSESLTTAPTLYTTATAASHVAGNPYTINASGAVDADYTINYVAGLLTVTPAPLTISANNQSKVYGAGLPTLTASYSGLVNGDTLASLTSVASLSTTATATSHVSGNPYPIAASGAADADYAISYAAAALTVTPAPLTIAANSQSKLYGAALPTLTASYAGFVNGDTSASLTSLASLSTTATAASHVAGSPYTISASGAVDADYAINYVAGALTVTPVPLTIAANNQSKVYGAALPTLTASYTGLVNGDTSASLTTAPSFSTTATAASHVSGNPYTITAGGAVDADYAISYAAAALTVTPAPLTIAANNQSKLYGAALPTLTAGYAGLVNGDTSTSLTTAPSLSTTATAASHVSGSPYTITASGAADADYAISYAAGALTVTPAPLTIAANNRSKVYGAALPTLTASYSGLVNGDTSESLTTAPTLSTTATAGSHVSGGPYTITASGAVDADYAISYAAGALTVTPVPLTIAANSQSKVYGATLPTLTASYTGLVNGDTSASLTTAPRFSTTATAGSSVSGSPYTIGASGAADADYTINYVAGLLTVTPAPLTITANNQSIVYGSAPPPLTASYTGLVNGDTAESLTTAPSLSTTATSASAVGSYIITVSGAVDPNYTMTYASGAIAVTPAPLTVTADNQSKVYGGADPSLSYTVTGTFYNGDGASLIGGVTLATARGAAATAGTHAITAGGGTAANYAITDVNGTLTVSPAPLTVTADNQSEIYGAPNPTLTYTVTGTFYNGDGASLIGGVTLATARGAAATVGTHAIAASGGTAANYAITDVNGTLTVSPAPLTIAADNQSKVYGAALPTLAASYTGLVNGDTAESLTTMPNLSTPATAASQVGGYAITAGGAVDPNYTISYASATLTVTPAPLTIAATNQTKLYGASLPALTASYSGFVNGDTAASLTTAASLSTTATAGSHVSASPYAINVGGAMDADYSISYVAGTLTVAPAALTIAANNQSKVYGATDPAFTASYWGFVPGEGPANLAGAVLFTTNEPAGNAPVGSYTIAPSGLTSADYAISLFKGTLSVSPAPLIVMANGASKTYGSADPTFSASYAGFAPGDNANNLQGALSFTTNEPSSGGAPVGSYQIQCSGLTSANYAVTFADGTLAVTPAPLTITANNQTKLYGAALPTLTASYTGLVNGDTAESLTTAASLSTSATAASPVGGYTISAGGAVDANYTISYASATLTVNPAPLTITANNQSKVYGASDPALTYTVVGTFYNGDGPSLVNGVTLTTATGAAATAGTHAITASGGTAANYAISDVNGTLTVSQAPLTVTANNQSKVYGAAEPSLSYTASGTLYYGDQYSLVNGVTLTTATGAAATAGTHAITANGGTAANYAISDANGTLTVSQAPLTVTANNQSKVYGAADPALTYTPSGTLYYGDQYSAVSGVSLTTATGAAATAGTHAITASGGTAANYAINDVNGTLTVSQAPLTVTANNQSKVYGAADPALTYTPSGTLYYGDQYSLISGVTLTTATGAAATAGTHAITASGGAAANYAISDVNGTLTVSQAPLTVTANNQSKVYGAADPALTYRPSGTLYYGDQYSLVSGVSLTTATGAAATAGTHAITASGGTAANYAINDVNGTLTVSRAPLTVTANNQSKVYGAAEPALSYTPSGTLYYGDQYSAVSGVSLSTATGAAATAGTHAITARGGTAANYAISDVNGTLTVSQAPLTVTANNQSKVYGAADPALTYTPSGTLYYGDQYSAVSGVTLTTATGAAATAGTHAITASGGTAANYAISDVNGTLTVSQAAITVTADNESKVYGAADPAFTASYSGFQYGQALAASGVTGAPSLTSTDDVTSPSGSYPITAGVGTLSAQNYSFSFVNGTLTILPAPTFTLTGPSSGTFAPGQGVTIGWTAANVDVAGVSKISLGYDQDSTAFDANEHWIEVDQVTAANGAAAYSWNTTGVAAGTYYLGGYMYDSGTDQAVYSNLATPIAITVSAPVPVGNPTFTLTGPSSGTFTSGQSVTVQWTAANIAAAGATKISLGYDRDATAFDANEHWLEVDQVTAANGAASYSWNTSGVAAGTYYLSGYSYDFSTSQAVYSHLGTSIVMTSPPAPTFALTGPGSGTFTTGQGVTIQWTAASVDVNGPSKISLGYDRDATAFDANEHWIEVDQVIAGNGAAGYRWNTAGVAAGTYYLNGYIFDFDTGKAVYAHLGTSIVITPAPIATFALSGPSSGTFSAGQSVTIGWTAANVDLNGPSKISLGYDRDATAFDANEQWFEVDQVTAANGAATYSWNTTGVAAGTYYLSGYIFDFASGEAVYSHLGTSIVIT